MRPVASTAIAYAMSAAQHAVLASRTIAFPAFPKPRSADPSAFNRATAKFKPPPGTRNDPAIKIRPDASVAIAYALSSLTPKDTTARPDVPNVVSSAPSRVRRATTMSVAAPQPVHHPATRTLPSGCTAIALALEPTNPTSRIVFPPEPKEASIAPPALSRIAKKSSDVPGL